MPQDHLDRLSSVDAGFLHAEDGGDAHMHIGAVAVFDGPAPPIAEVHRHVASRLHLVPRYRQRLVMAPMRSGRPLWADDPDFSLAYHVRHTALPAPGDEEQLRVLAGRVVSQRLDRSKPLWELWVAEGLREGRWALVNKTHHALVDGMGGVDVLTALLDLEADPPPKPATSWTPTGTPGTAGLLAHGARGLAGRLGGLAAGTAQRALDPVGTAAGALGAARALGEVVRTLVDPAPASPLNARPGPHRRFATASTRLADYKAIKDAVGGTVNDVVLTVVAGAVGRYLRERGHDIDGEELRACVPVSVRTDDERGSAGNRITILVAPLPVGVRDPLARLGRVRADLQGLKDSQQAVGAELLTRMEDFLPPTVLAQASRLQFSPRLYNVLVTNVPGPQFPVYLLGRRMRSIHPVAFLSRGHLLAVGVVSYDGQLNVGLLGDYDGLPDLDLLARHVETSLAELLAAARAAA